MAQPERIDPLPASRTAPPATEVAPPWGRPADARALSGGDYAAGGEVGQMHAELAQRLAHVLPAAETAPVQPAERLIRLLSMTGGFAALAAAYAGVAYAMLR